jgi:hypothetical protein
MTAQFTPQLNVIRRPDRASAPKSFSELPKNGHSAACAAKRTVFLASHSPFSESESAPHDKVRSCGEMPHYRQMGHVIPMSETGTLDIAPWGS